MSYLFAASLSGALLLSGSAFAGKPVERKKAVDGEAVFVTGSLIPQRIKLRRIGTTTTSPLRIIDRREIDQTGRRTTPGVFVADPSVRIVGH